LTGTVKIYNSAGELVGTLYDLLPLYQMPVGLSPLSATFSPDLGGSGALQLVGPNLPLIWAGTSDNGQLVASGIYNIVVQVHDGFGLVTTWTQTLTVLRADASTSVEVYNSAGEMVWHDQAVPLSPGIVGVSGREIVPGTGSSGLKITYGTGPSDFLTWNGTGSGGQALSSGTYMVKVTQSGLGGKTTTSYSITLLQANSQVFAWAAAAPNPVVPGVSSIIISLQGAAPGITAWGEVYNLVGEHSGTLSAVSGGNLLWNIPSSLAGGVYLIQVSARDTQGHLKTTAVKVALVR
jgi:hypothetical protein